MTYPTGKALKADMENNDKVNKILVNNIDHLEYELKSRREHKQFLMSYFKIYELLIKSTEPVIVRFLSYGECTDLIIDIKDIRNKVIDYGGMF
jgi:hypothetical protein